MARRALVLLKVAVALALISPTFAGNFTLTVSEDTRRVMDLGVFGFSSNGVLHLSIHHLSMKSKQDEQRPEPIGFTLDRVITANHARQEKNYGKGEGATRKSCFIEDPKVTPVAGWRKLYPLEGKLKEGKIEKLSFTEKVTEPGLYALFFYNCKGYDDKNISLQSRPVSFKVAVSEFNIGADGSRDYISVGNQKLDLMYLGFTFIFGFLAVSWIHAMRTQSQYVHKIHHVMALLVILKTISLFFEAMKVMYFKRYGTASAWDYMYYTFLTLKGMALFLVILLLGTGWSIVKPYLSTNDKRIALAILPLQVVINIALAVLDETSEGNRSWAYWQELLRVLDLLCCFFVMLPILWSLKSTWSVVSDGKMARNVVIIRHFRTLYLFIACFIYFTRFFVNFLDNFLSFRLTWVAAFVQEAAAVIFYLFTGMKFRPMSDNAFLALEEDDLEDINVQEELREKAVMRSEEEKAAAGPGLQSKRAGASAQ
eukprot:Sspe_Gene.93579::Locus_66179_Transcript_1_1_Confidence_1.000_Length_1567::g.93579::m.93579